MAADDVPATRTTRGLCRDGRATGLADWYAPPMRTNVLYYGDNLDILRHEPPYIPPESVDLVYLDPPFNSNAAYSVIFKDESGRGSDAQIGGGGIRLAPTMNVRSIRNAETRVLFPTSSSLTVAEC